MEEGKENRNRTEGQGKQKGEIETERKGGKKK